MYILKILKKKVFFLKKIKGIFCGHNSFEANVRPGLPQSDQIGDKKYRNFNKVKMMKLKCKKVYVIFQKQIFFLVFGIKS